MHILDGSVYCTPLRCNLLSVQVLDIIGRHRLMPNLIADETLEFLTIHKCFDSPDRVLQDHVSLRQVHNSQIRQISYKIVVAFFRWLDCKIKGDVTLPFPSYQRLFHRFPKFGWLLG